MKTLSLTSILVLLTACDGSNERSLFDLFDRDSLLQSTEWIAGQYAPSINFANRCAEPRSNSNYQDIVGTVTDENNWIRSWSHETYLWYNELPDINPATIIDPIDYFRQMKTDAVTDSGRSKDRFHFTYDANEWNQLSESGISVGYGLKISLMQSQTRKAIVVFSEPHSPAADDNISRGAEIISIDGVSVSSGDMVALNAALFPSTIGESHSFVIRDLNTNSNRTVTLQSAEITEVPVYKNQVISQGSKKIGYMCKYPILNTTTS